MIAVLQHLYFAQRIQRYVAILVAQRNLLDGHLALLIRMRTIIRVLLVDGTQHDTMDAFADPFDYAIAIGGGWIAHRHLGPETIWNEDGCREQQSICCGRKIGLEVAMATIKSSYPRTSYKLPIWRLIEF